MPVTNGFFRRIWRFAEQFSPSDPIYRRDLDEALDDLADGINSAMASGGNEAGGPLLTCSPLPHRHTIANVENLQAALDEKFSPNNPQPGLVVRTFATDAEAEAFAAASPDAIVFSTEGV